MKLNYIIAITLFAGASTLSFSQCPSPSQLVKLDKKTGWNESSQSKSGALQAGEVYEYAFIAQRGLEYRITALGGADDINMNNVEFKLYSNEVDKIEVDGKPVYKRLEKEVYNSEASDMGSQWIFSTSQTRKLTMKVHIVNTVKPEAIQCVAVYVETRRSIPLGFN